jgi:hypothetical protein
MPAGLSVLDSRLLAYTVWSPEGSTCARDPRPLLLWAERSTKRLAILRIVRILRRRGEPCHRCTGFCERMEVLPYCASHGPLPSPPTSRDGGDAEPDKAAAPPFSGPFRGSGTSVYSFCFFPCVRLCPRSARVHRQHRSYGWRRPPREMYAGGFHNSRDECQAPLHVDVLQCESDTIDLMPTSLASSSGSRGTNVSNAKVTTVNCSRTDPSTQSTWLERRI